MLVNLHHILLILTSFLFFMFSVFLVTYKKGNTLSYKFLAVFLFSHAILLFDRIFMSSSLPKTCPHLLSIGWPFIYLFSPAMFLYTQSITEKSFKLKKRHLLHLLPFFIFTSVAVFIFYIKSGEFKLAHFAPCVTLPDPARTIHFTLIECQFFVYAFLSLRWLHQYRRRIKIYYSTIDQINLDWLSTLLYSFILWRIVFVMTIYLPIRPSALKDTLGIILDIAFWFFAMVLIFKSLQQSTVFLGIPETVDQPKYKNSPIAPNLNDQYVQKVNDYMKNQKPYLIPSLTIQELAQSLSIHSKILSQVLNESFGKSFYDFINGYRIDEAKQRLASPDYVGKTVLEILYDVGFNSKAAFNRIFKEYTGITPTQFRNQMKTSG